MLNRTNMLRSSLGGQFAGAGITQDSTLDDDFVIKRGIKVHRQGFLPTDQFVGNKAAFDEYCKQQSGEVVSYSINELLQ
ncbi:hypothetical protein [Bacillus subtilis]|uniref:hypothetical protein n=1 Tax=Bacillus subtilis TaxID=1423 RepID=UPI0021D7EAC0|nr:hypothetical protein [Bacillus subtilis]